MVASPAHSDDTFELEAAEVCEILNRWSGRIEGHQNNRRTHMRYQFQAKLVAYTPDSRSFGDDRDWKPISIVGRNLSAGGIGFLLLDRLLEDQIIVVLKPATLFLGTIVRQRKVHRGYWDVGVKFSKRLDPEADKDLWPAEEPTEAAATDESATDESATGESADEPAATET